MATVALAVGGGYLATAGFGWAAGSVGALALGAAGSMLGGYLDNKYVYPALFPPDSGVNALRLDDIAIQTASEGNPINVVKGTARCAGTILWMSDMSRKAIRESTKGGGRDVTVGYKYSMDIAVAIAEGEVTSLKKIIADGKTIYDASISGPSVSGTNISVSGSELYHEEKTDFDSEQGVERRYITFEAPSGAADLTSFKSGEYVTVTGCSNEENNGEWLCLSTETDASTGATRVRLLYERVVIKGDLQPLYLVNTGDVFILAFNNSIVGQYTVQPGDTESDLYDGLVASWEANKGSNGRAVDYTAENKTTYIQLTANRGKTGDITAAGDYPLVITEDLDEEPVDESAGATIQLSQSLPTDDAASYDNVTFYPGSDSQSVDDIVEAHEGSGNVPAFRGIAYVVIEGLQLGSFGNRPPQFNFIVEDTATLDVGDLIGYLIERAGLTASDYDTSELSASVVDGYIIPSPRTMAAALKDILFSNSIVMYEDEGKLIFKDRDNIENETVEIGDVAATASEMAASTPFELIDNSDAQFPSQVIVDYFDKNSDYQKGSQSDKKVNSDYENTEKINLPVSMEASGAKSLAKRELWSAYSTRVSVKMQLPPKYSYLTAGDSISITYNGEDYTFFISSMTYGVNGVVELAGTFYDADVYTQTAEADAPGIHEDALEVPPTLSSVFVDIAPMRSEDEQVPGVYVGSFCDDINANFRGGIIADSRNIFSDYMGFGLTEKPFSIIDFESTGGEAITKLEEPDSGDISGFFDLVNTVQVKLYHGELSSCDEIDVLNGDNIAFLGNEIIGFQTATLVDTNTYELSKLLRGFRNSEAYMDKHEVREEFLLLSGRTNRSLLNFAKMKLSELLVGKYYKTASTGQDSDYPKPKKKTFMANNVRPWSPCHVVGSRDGSLDLTVTWIRRTRSIFRFFSGQPTPLIDTPEKYEVDIYNPSDEVVRTFKVAISDSERSEVIDGDETKQWPDTTKIEYPAGTVNLTKTRTTYAMSASDNSIRDTSNNFIADGFSPGAHIVVSGFSNAENNGNFLIVSVAADKMILSGGTVVTENIGPSVTVKQYDIVSGDQANDGLVPGDPIKMRLYQINSLVGRGKHKEVEI